MRSHKAISYEEFRIRDKAIKKQRQTVHNMKTRLDHEKKILSQSAKQHLPNLNELNQFEMKAVEQYLDGRFYTARDIYTNISRLVPWVNAAVTGKGRLRSIFRLARIKSYLHKIKAESHKVNLDIELQSKLLGHMIEITTGEKPSPLYSILEQSSKAFHSANQIQEAIVKLERETSLKKQEIHYMKNWLLEARTNIRRKVPEPPPDLSALKLMSRDLDTYGIDHVNRSKERLTLASVYIQNYVKKFARWDQAKQEL